MTDFKKITDIAHANLKKIRAALNNVDVVLDTLGGRAPSDRFYTKHRALKEALVLANDGLSEAKALLEDVVRA